METFKELNLKTEILKAVEEAGYNKPMRIQAEAIPVALEGKDIIGCAQTGTGKTAAFTLPILGASGTYPGAHARAGHSDRRQCRTVW